jgi:hypothetical protein
VPERTKDSHFASNEAGDDQLNSGKDKAAQELGRRGGEARAANLSKERRAEIARKAARMRWARDSA